MTSFDELHQIITQGENARVEFKAEATEEVIRGLSTDIAAMANSQGGVIIFGVTNEKDPRGLALKGDEREKISQNAMNCIPSISVDFEEIHLGARAFLLVKIPRSTVIHSDSHRKFPTRIGNTTGYLDAFGLVALLQEKGLVKGEAQQYAQMPPSERKRERLPPSDEAVLVRSLNSGDASVRLEALRDLVTLPYFYNLLESDSLATSLEGVLKAKTVEEIKLVLQVLRVIVLRGNDHEKEIVQGWTSLILDAGKTLLGAEISVTAFQILMYSRRPEALGLMMHWITKMDDNAFTSIRPDQMLMESGVYGLKTLLHEEMYKLLLDNPSDKVRSRVSIILQSLRQAYTP